MEQRYQSVLLCCGDIHTMEYGACCYFSRSEQVQGNVYNACQSCVCLLLCNICNEFEHNMCCCVAHIVCVQWASSDMFVCAAHIVLNSRMVFVFLVEH